MNRTIFYTFSHEDIKDAMLSLVHLMRENTEKLERHEVRERQLGDQMKKAIGLLSKKMNALEEIQIRFIESDKRITDLEQLYYQVSSLSTKVFRFGWKLIFFLNHVKYC